MLSRAYRYDRDGIISDLQPIAAGHEFEIDQVAARTGLRLLEAGGDFADGVILDDMHNARVSFWRHLTGTLHA